MNNTFDDLKNLNDEDIYSVALLILFVLKDNPRYSTISELSYILDKENFLKFINYYSGQKIEIPTMDEISKALKTIILYKYYIIDELDWKSSLIKSGFSTDESYVAQRLLTSFKRVFKEYNVGDLFNEKK